MKTYWKWIGSVLGCIGAILGICVVVVIWVDPFFQYHAPMEDFPYIIDNQLNQNPGMARNMEYDSVILGSSMTVDFQASWFAELFKEDAIKLNYNGAYPKDQSNIMKQVFRDGRKVKTVYLGIDMPAYSAPAEETKFPVPEYLYDDKWWNDIGYWFNKDVILQYILRPMVQPEEATDLNTVYQLPFLAENYNIEEVLYTYQEPEVANEEKEADYFLSHLELNLDNNILPYIEEHTETQFVVFFPPASILYWNNVKREGILDAVLEEFAYAAKRLLAYENVQLYLFLDQEWIVCDLNNYADYNHYSSDINRYMAECFQSGTCKLTEESLQERIDKLRFLAEEVSMDKIYTGELLPENLRLKYTTEGQDYRD